MAPKRLPLPRRFNVAMTEKAYARLRSLNDDYGYGNNYLLTFLLENFDEVVDQAALQKLFKQLDEEYGSPKRTE